MADIFQKVNDGDPLRIPAKLHNHTIDAVQDFLRRKSNISADRDTSKRDHVIVTIRNDSGADRNQFEVLGLGEPFIKYADNNDEFKYGPNFKGLVTTAAHVGKFAILLDPIAQDQYGDGMLLGVTATELSVTAEGDTHADVEAGQYKLKTATSGAAEILWKASGTGDKWGYVRLGGGASGGNAAILQITGSTLVSGYQDAKIIDAAEGAENDPVKVYNRYTSSPAIAVGEYVDGVKKTGGPATPGSITVPVYAIAYKECPT